MPGRETQFGISPAALTLVKLIDKLPDKEARTQINEKLSRYFQEFSDGLRELEGIGKASVKRELAKLWLNWFVDGLDFGSPHIKRCDNDKIVEIANYAIWVMEVKFKWAGFKR